MAARTLRSTSAEKRCVPLTNFETVEMETPAADAMSRMVSLLFIGCEYKGKRFPSVARAMLGARRGRARLLPLLFGLGLRSLQPLKRGGLPMWAASCRSVNGSGSFTCERFYLALRVGRDFCGDSTIQD